MKTPEIGTVLRSRYALTEQLGMNATRQTWLAEDREQNTTVVVKMLAFNLQLQWQEVKLFEREAPRHCKDSTILAFPNISTTSQLRASRIG